MTKSIIYIVNYNDDYSCFTNKDNATNFLINLLMDKICINLKNMKEDFEGEFQQWVIGRMSNINEINIAFQENDIDKLLDLAHNYYDISLAEEYDEPVEIKTMSAEMLKTIDDLNKLITFQ
jgi:hypothetical protein